MIQQLTTSFDKLSNNQGIRIISWEEVQNMLQTMMNYVQMNNKLIKGSSQDGKGL
jgi:hypothetical protein